MTYMASKWLTNYSNQIPIYVNGNPDLQVLTPVRPSSPSVTELIQFHLSNVCTQFSPSIPLYLSPCTHLQYNTSIQYPVTLSFVPWTYLISKSSKSAHKPVTWLHCTHTVYVKWRGKVREWVLHTTTKKTVHTNVCSAMNGLSVSWN